MSIFNSERHKCKSSLSDKISTIAKKITTMPGLYISRKIRSSQLSRRVKDYLPQETALHSLLLRYRFSYSMFIVRPRTQSLRFADTRPKRSSIHFHCRIKSPRRIPILAGIYLFIPARTDRWFASIWRDLSRMTKFGIEKRGLVWRRVC